MKPEKGKVYEIEYWVNEEGDVDSSYKGLARCTSDEPMAQEGKLDLWMFDLLDTSCGSEWAFFAAKDVKREKKSRIGRKRK